MGVTSMGHTHTHFSVDRLIGRLGPRVHRHVFPLGEAGLLASFTSPLYT